MLTDLLSSPLIPLLVVTHTAAFCAGAILEYVTEREIADRRGARVASTPDEDPRGDRGVE